MHSKTVLTTNTARSDYTKNPESPSPRGKKKVKHILKIICHKIQRWIWISQVALQKTPHQNYLLSFLGAFEHHLVSFEQRQKHEKNYFYLWTCAVLASGFQKHLISCNTRSELRWTLLSACCPLKKKKNPWYKINLTSCPRLTVHCNFWC